MLHLYLVQISVRQHKPIMCAPRVYRTRLAYANVHGGVCAVTSLYYLMYTICGVY